MAAVLFCGACGGLNAQNTEVLTNQSVVDLVKNGIGADLIVKMIQEQPNRFNLSSSSVIRLKQQGVPKAVLEAMLNSHSQAAGGNAPGGKQAAAKQEPAASSEARSAKPNYTWETVTKADAMSGQTNSTLLLNSPAVTEDGARVGTFQLQATCTAAQLDLKLMFAADATPGYGFKQNTTTYYETGGLFGAMANASHHKKSWTETRVRIGNGSPGIATSEADYKNETDLYFVTRDPRTASDKQDGDGILMFASMLTPNKPAGVSGDFFAAPRVLLESTFEDGTQAILEVHPQDASFLPFAARCKELAGTDRAAPQQEASSSGNAYSGGRPAAQSYRPSVPVAPRLVVSSGSSLTVTLLEAANLDAARSGKLIHAKLAQAMQSPSAATGQQELAMPAGTDIYLRVLVVGTSANQYTIRVESEYAVQRGVNVPVRASAPNRTVSHANPSAPTSINVGRYGRFSLPRNTDTQGSAILLKSNEQLALSVNQTTFVPASLRE